MGDRGDCCDRLPDAVLTLNAAIIWGALLARDPHSSLLWEAGRKSRVEPHHAYGCLCVALLCGAGRPRLSWGSTRLWCLQPGCQKPVPTECPVFWQGQESCQGHLQWAQQFQGQFLHLRTGTVSRQYRTAAGDWDRDVLTCSSTVPGFHPLHSFRHNE